MLDFASVVEKVEWFMCNIGSWIAFSAFLLASVLAIVVFARAIAGIRDGELTDTQKLERTLKELSPKIDSLIQIVERQSIIRRSSITRRR